MKRPWKRSITKGITSFWHPTNQDGSDFSRQSHVIQRRTTLASGEAAVVLQGEKEQFVISAEQFLAGVQPS
jgi:hypothetical protein